MCARNDCYTASVEIILFFCHERAQRDVANYEIAVLSPSGGIFDARSHVIAPENPRYSAQKQSILRCP